MSRRTDTRRRAAVALLLAAACLYPLAADPVPSEPGSSRAIADSAPARRLEGRIELAGSGPEPLALRLVPGAGGLLDLPSRGIYGYPLASVSAEEGRITFTLGSGEAAVVFQGEDPSGTELFEGSLRQGSAEGRFRLAPAPAEAGVDRPVELPSSVGPLRGSLLLPEGEGPFPLAILLSGAGAADREGNNYAVPGRSDCLRQLAYELRDRGIASLRYDKRGSGESYWLAPTEEELRFGDYIADARLAVELAAADPRFSSVTLLGHTEGALVGAAAIADATIGDPDLVPGSSAEARPPVRLVLLAASSKSALEVVSEALAEIPPELAAEAEALMSALAAGQVFPGPSEYFADFFRPSFQPYLASWLRYDLKDELRRFPGEVLLVHGDRDFQVSLADFFRLAALRPEAPALVVPEMNHALKAVPPDLDENYRAFSDPFFPLAEGLAEAVAAFIRGEALPSGLPRVDGGILPAASGRDLSADTPPEMPADATTEGVDGAMKPAVDGAVAPVEPGFGIEPAGDAGDSSALP